MQWNKPLLAIPAWDNLASDLQTASKFVAPTSSTAENEKNKLIDAFKIQVQKSLFLVMPVHKDEFKIQIQHDKKKPLLNIVSIWP